jgi:hypothetical protein
MFHRISNGLAKLRDVLSTYERFDSLDLVNYIDEVGVAGLTCRTPGGEVLFRNLSFRVRQGESLLIMGPSGSGAWRADVARRRGAPVFSVACVLFGAFAPALMRTARGLSLVAPLSSL